MSRFFRSGTSTSSEDDCTSDSEYEARLVNTDTGSNVSARQDALALRSLRDQSGVESSAAWENHHRDFLLHALLEERCMNEVLRSHADVRSGRHPSRDLPEVQAEANERYQRLCMRLASYNLISTGLEQDGHSVTRQRYREGLDLLSAQRSTTTAFPPSLRRLLTDSNAGYTNHANPVHTRIASSPAEVYLQRPAVSYPTQRLLTGGALGPTASLSPSRKFFESRYQHEFEELSTLGRGGYGIVYHVRHRLDNQVYAVKKVPLSAARLQRIQHRGQPELDEVLRELRTLARLDHPNIVRFFSGWIEWVDDIAIATTKQLTASGASQVPSRDSEDAVMGAEESQPYSPACRIITENSLDEEGVVFEKSEATPARADNAMHTTSFIHDDPDQLELRRMGTRSTIATISDEINESVDRPLASSISIQSASSAVQFAEPTLALHMQMSVHPMTLAEFLAPPITHEPGQAPPLKHCFHLQPSVSILHAILDGIEYLHAEGIFHRDIKPANIFLGPHSNPRPTRGSLDLLQCKECRAQNTVDPLRLEVRIGDFGLVAVANPDVAATVDLNPVGTEIYRPTTAQAPGPSLDIYALGIVTFELLWKFDTRMERLHILQRLKRGEFPTGFLAHVEDRQAAVVKDCIKAMLLHNDDDGISITELRRKLTPV